MIDKLITFLQRMNPTPAAQPVDLPNGLGQMVVVHDGYTLQTFNDRKRKSPRHIFESVDDFCLYLNREHRTGGIDPDAADVLVAADKVVAHEDARNVDEAVVSCKLAAHPLWRRWLQLARGDWHSSADMFDALRALQDTFGTTTMRVDGKPTEVPAGPPIVDSLRRVQVSTGGDMRVERGAGGMVRVSSKSNDTTIQTDLVDEWPLRLAIFEGAPDLLVDVDVLVSWKFDKDAGDLLFKLSIPLAKMAENEARGLVVERLRERMPWATVGAGVASTSVYRPE